MDMSGIDMGVIVALFGLFWKSAQDKAHAAMELGRLKQQVAQLQARDGEWVNRFEDMQKRLEVLVSAVTRIEIICERDYKARTPIPNRQA